MEWREVQVEEGWLFRREPVSGGPDQGAGGRDEGK